MFRISEPCQVAWPSHGFRYWRTLLPRLGALKLIQFPTNSRTPPPWRRAGFAWGSVPSAWTKSSQFFGCVSGQRPMIRHIVSAMCFDNGRSGSPVFRRRLGLPRLRSLAKPDGTIRWSHKPLLRCFHQGFPIRRSYPPVRGVSRTAHRRRRDTQALRAVLHAGST